MTTAEHGSSHLARPFMSDGSSTTFKKTCGVTGRRITASYHPPSLAVYRHNPYIEALPEQPTDAHFFKCIRRSPAYSSEDRNRSALVRQEAVQILDYLLTPLPIHAELIKQISSIIKSGYFARNPISTEHIRQMRAAFPAIDLGDCESDCPIILNKPSRLVIIGTSGTGKTTGVDTCLLQLPQVIVHTQYNGHPFDQTQLVWLKLECPYDGSIKGLCIDFFQTVNRLVGKNIPSQSYAKLSLEVLVQEMARVAALYGLGALIIDEIQNLNEAKSGGSQLMLNLFKELQNKIGVPVIMIGTFKVKHLLGKSFATVRRLSDITWLPMAHDREWELFIKTMWRYQWTKHETPLTDELSLSLHDESQGIIDIAIKLYKIVQWMLIDDQNHDERITPELISKAATEHLSLVRPILLALKEKNFALLDKLADDLHPLAAEISAYFESIRKDAAHRAALAQLQHELEEQSKTTQREDFVRRLSHMLVDLEYPPQLAQACASQALNQCGEPISLQNAMKVALKLAGKQISPNTKTRRTRDTAKACKSQKASGGNSDSVGKSLFVLPNGILATVAAGREHGLSAHEALVQAGMVDSLDSYLT